MNNCEFNSARVIFQKNDTAFTDYFNSASDAASLNMSSVIIPTSNERIYDSTIESLLCYQPEYLVEEYQL